MATAAVPTPAIPAVAPVSGFTTVWGVTINPSVIVLSLLLIGVGYMLWQGQRDKGRNTFDMWDLVMDDLPDSRRRASGIKLAFMSAFVLSSWVVVDNEIKHTLTEGIFGLYLGTWCVSLIAKVIFNKQDLPKLPGVKE